MCPWCGPFKDIYTEESIIRPFLINTLGAVSLKIYTPKKVSLTYPFKNPWCGLFKYLYTEESIIGPTPLYSLGAVSFKIYTPKKVSLDLSI